MKKRWPKNSPILTKIGMHIDQTSDYYHAKFYLNRATFSDDKLPQSCPILIRFCMVIVKSILIKNMKKSFEIFHFLAHFFSWSAHARWLKKFVFAKKLFFVHIFI